MSIEVIFKTKQSFGSVPYQPGAPVDARPANFRSSWRATRAPRACCQARSSDRAGLPTKLRLELGDARCKINLGGPGRRGSGTVMLVVNSFTFLASGLSDIASGALTHGKLAWSSGANSGLAVEIRAHAAAADGARIGIALPRANLCHIQTTVPPTTAAGLRELIRRAERAWPELRL